MWRRIWQYVADRAAGRRRRDRHRYRDAQRQLLLVPELLAVDASLRTRGFNRYPGDKYVDWVGIDAYARANTGATPTACSGSR
jgi:hypothetical protein